MQFSVYYNNPNKINELQLNKLKNSKLIKEVYTFTDDTYKSILNSINNSTSEYIFLLHEKQIFDEEILLDYLELIEEQKYDLIYPHYIIENKIKNFSDWNQRNLNLLQTFNIENEVPMWGSLLKVESFKTIDANRECYSFYDFLYKNLSNLSLKLAEFSFLETKTLDQYNKHWFKSKILREILDIYNIQKEIFSYLNWHEEKVAYATAYTFIGNLLFETTDYYNASKFYREALLFFHNRETTLRLIDTYIQMGLFDEAFKIIETQLDDKEQQQYFIKQIDSIKNLIEKLENLATSNNLSELLDAENDIKEVYNGALINNIFGVAYFHNNQINKAYQEFLKAFIKNPLDSDIIQNLINIGKRVGKEDEIKEVHDCILQ